MSNAAASACCRAAASKNIGFGRPVVLKPVNLLYTDRDVDATFSTISPESTDVEFVKTQNMLEILQDYGVKEQPPTEDELIYLSMADNVEAVHLHIASDTSQTPPRDDARVVQLPRSEMPQAIEEFIGRLHLDQVLLIPVHKWRNVFDSVAFSMADDEAWANVDAAATVALNRRDPLLFEPADHQTLRRLLRALMNDAEEPSQGVMLTTTTAPVLIDIIPDGTLRVSVGNPALADEVVETIAAYQKD